MRHMRETVVDLSSMLRAVTWGRQLQPMRVALQTKYDSLKTNKKHKDQKSAGTQ